MKLLVRNLARTLTEAELKALFERFGDVSDCTLVMDEHSGESKGFGFVDMPSYDKARKAMFTLNGKLIERKPIKIRQAD
ncbi:RNA recognition motif domain-containing protein [Ferrimonas kyonanensis]|uniref:RNA recognition motif domain-containing protein n=1 Tax=Ferrimonas kyonanensis TaxID=364763 RepID=UPI00047F0307|nr:RNA-binding protein [Ferrimonas kyonanensis]